MNGECFTYDRLMFADDHYSRVNPDGELQFQAMVHFDQNAPAVPQIIPAHGSDVRNHLLYGAYLVEGLRYPDIDMAAVTRQAYRQRHPSARTRPVLVKGFDIELNNAVFTERDYADIAKAFSNITVEARSLEPAQRLAIGATAIALYRLMQLH